MKKLFTLIVFMFVFVGCSNSGKDFIGKWETTETNPREIEIVANGKNYMIKGITSSWDGRPIEVSAIYEKGSLIVKVFDSHDITPDMASYFTLKYNNANDTVTLEHWLGKAVYHRSK